MNNPNDSNIKSLLQNKPFAIISQSQLSELLRTFQVVYEQDTRLRDFIRILKADNMFLFQEKTNRGEIIVRKFDSESEARKLLNERMEIYDKMWDGCGCKINYYE